jgi:5'-nucleotidase
MGRGRWRPGWSWHRSGQGGQVRSQVYLTLTCRVIKSGTDFRDLSSANLELSDTPSGSVRRKVITSLTGKHHYILPSNPSSTPMNEMLSELLSSVEGTLQKPVCFTLTPFDARSEVVRTKETGLGNWVADVLMHAYAESLIEGGHQDFFEKQKKEGEANEKGAAAAENDEMRKRKGGADAVIICGGTLRGDSQYGPGKITLGDILGQCLRTFLDRG